MNFISDKIQNFIRKTLFVSILLLPIFSYADQTPWKTTVGNSSSQTNLNWSGYNTGYEFTVLKTGTITKLGGLYNGTKTVRLYDSTGTQIAIANATDNNNWGYIDITPVVVTQGASYTVAVDTGFGGASMYIGGSGFGFGPTYPAFPHVIGDIQINRSVFGFGTSRPTWEIWGQMWGQPDITFVPDEVIIL